MRAEMVRSSSDQLQKIILTINQYNQAKEGDDEVEWKDFMYDIASIKLKGDHVEILALRDDLETELLSFAARIIQFSSGDSKAPPSALMQYISLSFTLPSNAISIEIRVSYDIIHYTLYQRNESNPISSIILPPPRG